MLKKPLVLVDGACVLCHRLARWLVANDKKRIFLIGAWQDDRVCELLAEKGVFPPFPDAIGLVDVSGNVHFADEAVWRICGILPWPWCVLGGIKVFPHFIRAYLYEWTARHRYAWFGKLSTNQLQEHVFKDALW